MLTLIIQYCYALLFTLSLVFYTVQHNENTRETVCVSVQCENTVDTLVRHLTKENRPRRFISEDVTANLHKAKQQENVFLREDVPVLSQDNSGESVVFEKQMLCREDERQLGKLTGLKDYATIHCCKMEVKCIFFFLPVEKALQ